MWWLLGCFYLAVVFYLSLAHSPSRVSEYSHIDKIEHFLAYGVLMGWFGQLLISTKYQFIFSILFCFLGIFLEFIQGWSGYRLFDISDMVANTLGVILGWWLTRTVFAGFLMRVDQGLSRLLGAKLD